VVQTEETRNACRTLVGKPPEKDPLGRPRKSWEDNIKMDLRKNVVQVGNGLNWLRIMFSDGLWH
jgi:hypothetical protein